MDFDDIQYKLNVFAQNLGYRLNVIVEKNKTYFESLDQWELVGWGGEAVGLILVIVSLFLF